MNTHETILRIMLSSLIALVLFSIVRSADRPIFIFSKDVPAQAMRVTAYCAAKCCCGKYADGVTASGHKIRPGDKFCAAPKSIPFGTMIDIPGYGRVPVLDRGGAIKEGRLDVYFDDGDGKSGHERALIWGVRNLQVKIAR